MISKNEKRCFVIGAINVDLVASAQQFQEHTSNPANLSISLGGVAYNIFQQLSISSTQKFFVTLIGDDQFTPLIENTLAAYSQQVLQQKITGTNNNFYLALMEQGELKTAAVSCSLTETYFTKNVIEAFLTHLNPRQNDWIIADANLMPDVLLTLIDEAKKRQCHLVFETVSLAKTKRVNRVLSDLELTTPTEEELLELVSDLEDETVLTWMQERRIHNIILTQGKKGCRHYSLSSLKSKVFLPTQVLQIKDSNGAGDFFLSALLSFIFENNSFSYEDTIPLAMKKTESYLCSKNENFSSSF